MKLTNKEIQEAYQEIQKFENKEIEGDLVWAIVTNLDELEEAYERYQKVYARHVRDQVVKDDDGNAVYPEGVDPENPGNVDPKFKDREKLVEELGNLLEKEVEVNVETVSRETFMNCIKSTVTPKEVRPLMFMIE